MSGRELISRQVSKNGIGAPVGQAERIIAEIVGLVVEVRRPTGEGVGDILEVVPTRVDPWISR